MPDIANGISTAVFTGYPVWCDVEDRSGGGTAVGSVDMQECGPLRLEAQVARLRLRLRRRRESIASHWRFCSLLACSH